MYKYLKHLIGAALLVGGGPALAGDLPPGFADGIMNDCRPDYHRVCSYVVPGEGRVARCLLDHERDLAPQCLRSIKLAYAIQACLPDYRRFCGGVPQGPQAVECLAARIDALIPECRRVVGANAPYSAPGGGRYSYNREDGPYSRPYPRVYSFGERPRPDERYPADNGPSGRRYGEGQYGDGPYAGQRYGEERYGDGRSGEEGGRRFQSYDERYADHSYDRYRERPQYGGPGPDQGYERDRQSPYEQGEEEREPVK